MATKRRSIRTTEFPVMSREEFKSLRLKLGKSQSQLAKVLGYSSAMRISELERESNPSPVPWQIGQLMRAMSEGFVPDGALVNPFD